MHYESDWNLYGEWFKVCALRENLLKQLMLIDESETNLSHLQQKFENFLDDLSKCGWYLLDFRDFWSKLAALLNS